MLGWMNMHRSFGWGRVMNELELCLLMNHIYTIERCNGSDKVVILINVRYVVGFDHYRKKLFGNVKNIKFATLHLKQPLGGLSHLYINQMLNGKTKK